jgi:hypothetical protein
MPSVRIIKQLRMPTTGRRVHRTAASRGARTQAIGSGFCALRLGCSSLVGLLRWDSGSGAASSTTIGGGHTGGLAVSLAMLTAGVADLRAAQHRAAQAAAARRAAEHLRGAVANHRSRSGPREVRVRARCGPHGLPGTTHGGPASLSGAPDIPPSTRLRPTACGARPPPR